MRHYLLALLLGALLPLAFAPFHAWYAGVASLTGLCLLWLSSQRTARIGFCYGLGYFGVGLHWVYISLHSFGGAPLIFAILANALMVLVLALFPLFAGLFLRWLSCPGTALRALLIPLLWMLGELARSYILSGFPWLSVGYSQFAAPLEGLAPLSGVFGIGLILMVIVSLLALTLHRRALLPGVIALLLAAICFPTRYLSFTTPIGYPFTVALVQGNIPQLTKFDPGLIHTHIGHYIDLSVRRNESVIIWPETAIAFMEEDVRDSVLLRLDRLLASRGQTLVTGIPTGDLANGIYYNSVITLGKGHGRYDKHHLLPFGEYLPLRSLFAIFRDYVDIPLADFSRGTATQMPISTNGIPAGVSICFEAAFGRVMRQSMPYAQYLINVSNDGWFEDSIAADQHLHMNQMRALELGREMARATNNGISVFLDHKGRIKQRLPRFTRDVLAGQVQPRVGLTPYARYGDTIFHALLAAYALFLATFAWAVRHARPTPFVPYHREQ
ncbi:MAG: apolipoprotein N-acyltransferase [Cardiobacteriaceae bacterium]|nr:apolipoprotein N-acyltransferase [Cardiobacteriaceae bacterium]